MNGRQLAREAILRLPKLKVLYTTGFSRNAVIHNGVLDQDVNFISKPFTIEQLAPKRETCLMGTFRLLESFSASRCAMPRSVNSAVWIVGRPTSGLPPEADIVSKVPKATLTQEVAA